MNKIKVRHGSEEWDDLRRCRLTASDYSKVLGGSDLHRLRLIADAPEDGFGRAKAQAETFERLKADPDNLGLKVADLSASGVKGLIDKGLAEKFIDSTACTLKKSAATKHIDYLTARILFTPAEMGEWTGNDATDRGHALEPLARIEFESLKGIDIETDWFLHDPGLPYVGASPDGLTSDGGTFETKSPLPQTHLGYMRKGCLPSEYWAQVHGQMALAGAPHAWFMSYCPGLPTMILKIERTGYTDNLLRCLGEFDSMMASDLASLREKMRLAQIPTTL